MPGYPYTFWIALVSIIIAILSMPFIAGQESGLIAGIIMVALYSFIYAIMRFAGRTQASHTSSKQISSKRYRVNFSTEFSKELREEAYEKNEKNKSIK